MTEYLGPEGTDDDQLVTYDELLNIVINSINLAKSAVDAGALADSAVESSKIKDAAVLLSKIQNLTTNRMLGRTTAGAGVCEQLNAAQVRTFLNVADGAQPALVASGTTPPSISKLWFNTTDNVIYYYDASRTQWLSTTEHILDVGLNNSSHTGNSIMAQGGGTSMLVTSSDRGFPVPFACTVTGWTWRTGAATDNRILRLTIYDSSASSTNTSHYAVTPADGWEEFAEGDLNVEYDESDLLGIVAYLESGMTDPMVYPRCTVTYRRRPSSGA